MILRRYGRGLKLNGQSLETDEAAFVLGGDVTGSGSATQVVGLRGRGLDPTAPVAGQALVYNGTVWVPGAAGLSNGVAQTFGFAGGTHDYTADANYVLSGYTGSGNGANWLGSDALGDGSSVPYFYALNKGNYATLKRTASNTLRIGPSNAVLGEPFPFSNSSLAIAIPLGSLETVTLDFVLSGNTGVGQANSCRVYTYCGLGRIESNNQNTVIGMLGFYWDTSNARVTDQVQGTCTPATHTGETLGAMDASFTTSGITTRRYSITLSGPVLTMLGAPIGSPLATPSAALWKKTDPTLLLSRRDKFLFLASGSSAANGATIGSYSELASLTVTGTRSYL